MRVLGVEPRTGGLEVLRPRPSGHARREPVRSRTVVRRVAADVDQLGRRLGRRKRRGQRERPCHAPLGAPSTSVALRLLRAPGDGVVQARSVTKQPCTAPERVTGLEPVWSTLARLCGTRPPHPHVTLSSAPLFHGEHGEKFGGGRSVKNPRGRTGVRKPWLDMPVGRQAPTDSSLLRRATDVNRTRVIGLEARGLTIRRRSRRAHRRNRTAPRGYRPRASP